MRIAPLHLLDVQLKLRKGAKCFDAMQQLSDGSATQQPV